MFKAANSIKKQLKTVIIVASSKPTPYTLRPIPYTLHPIPYTLYPIPYTYTLYLLGFKQEADAVRGQYAAEDQHA